MSELILTFPILVDPGMTDEKIVEQLKQQVEHLIELGALKGDVDSIVKDFEIQKDANTIAVTVPEEVIGTATYKFLTEGAGMSRVVEIPEEFRVTELKPVEKVFDRSFSMIQIVDRMKNAMRQPRQRFRYLVIDYKKYYKMAKRSLERDPEKAKKLKDMFITDVMGMITEILPLIQEGKQLQALVGTSQVSPKLNKSARELSLAYRRALNQEKSSGQINKAFWNKLKSAYTEFITILMNEVMPGIADIDTKNESRHYSELPDGRIQILKDWKEEREYNDPLADFKEMNADPAKEEGSRSEYSRTGDGRIRLFSNESELLENLVFGAQGYIDLKYAARILKISLEKAAKRCYNLAKNRPLKADWGNWGSIDGEEDGVTHATAEDKKKLLEFIKKSALRDGVKEFSNSDLILVSGILDGEDIYEHYYASEYTLESAKEEFKKTYPNAEHIEAEVVEDDEYSKNLKNFSKAAQKFFGNPVSSDLPDSLGYKLQDFAQFTNKISYADIYRYKGTPEQYKKLSNKLRYWFQCFDNGEKEKAERAAVKIRAIVKGETDEFSNLKNFSKAAQEAFADGDKYLVTLSGTDGSIVSSSICSSIGAAVSKIKKLADEGGYSVEELMADDEFFMFGKIPSDKLDLVKLGQKQRSNYDLWEKISMALDYDGADDDYSNYITEHMS